MTATPSTAAAVTRRARRTNGARRQISRALVWYLIAFLAIEYLRPPPLEFLHFPTLFFLSIPVLWLMSKDRPWSPVLTLQLSFLATGALALPFAANNYLVYLQSRVGIGQCIASLAVVWLLAYRKEFKLAVWSWVAMMCFEAVYGSRQQGRGYGSLFGDENDLALAFDVAFPFVFVGLRLLSGWRRWLVALAGALLATGVVTSSSRGGFLGLVAAAVYCVLVGRNRARNLAIGAGCALVLFLATPSGYKTEMETIGDTNSGTAEQRLFLWLGAVRMWKDHPIFGVGPGNANYYIGKYQPEGRQSGLFSGPEYWDRDYSGTALHSLYMQLLAERGLVGVAIFALLVTRHYTTLRRLRRSTRTLPAALARDVELYALALEAAMTGFLVAGAFLSVLYYPYFWFLTALSVALERAMRRDIRALSPAGRASEAEVRIGSRGAPAAAPS